MASESSSQTKRHEYERNSAIRKARIACDRCNASELKFDPRPLLVELRDATQELLAVLERELPDEGLSQRYQRAFAF